MPSLPRSGKVTFPVELRTFWLVSLGLAALCGGVEIFCARVLHLGYPYNWAFTPHGEHMLDFNSFRDKFREYHHNDFFVYLPWLEFAYPAPVAALYKLIYLNTYHPYVVFRLAILVWPALGAAWLWRAAVQMGYSAWTMLAFLASVTVVSYPLLFELKQGNVEIFICVLVVAGVALFLRGDYYAAAACFGVAGSMKIFPLIFLGLMISRRRWGAMFSGFVAAAVSTVVSLWLLCPDMGVAWRGVQAGIASFQTHIVLHFVRREIGFDHSLFSVVKWGLNAVTGAAPTPGILRGYMVVVAAGGTVLFFTRILRLPVVNQVMCLTIASILLPPASYEYTLLHLYLPWGLLVLLALQTARTGGRPVAGLGVLLGGLAVVLAPLSELIYRGVSVGGQARAVLLAGLWVLAMKYPLASEFDEVREAAAN